MPKYAGHPPGNDKLVIIIGLTASIGVAFLLSYLFATLPNHGGYHQW